MVRIATLALLLVITTSAFAQSSECVVNSDCPGIQECHFNQCIPKKCTASAQCPGGICVAGECLACTELTKCMEVLDRPATKKAHKKWDLRGAILKIVLEELAKLPKPTAVPVDPCRVEKVPDTKCVRIVCPTTSEMVCDGNDGQNARSRRTVVKSTQDGEVGGIAGWRQIGAIPEFNLGFDFKWIFHNVAYLKGGWEFGTAMVDNDNRQFQSLGLGAVGLRLDGITIEEGDSDTDEDDKHFDGAGTDIGIRAEYSQTGTKPFGGWDRRSWTTGVEVEVYPLIWAEVSTKWNRFIKISGYVGLGEEFKPGSTGSDLLFSSSLTFNLNAVF